MWEINPRGKADYEILEENHYKDWFLDHNFKGGAGYISYGQYIVHALWKLTPNKLDANKVPILLEQLESLCRQEINLTQINQSGIFQISYCKNNINNGTDGILIRDKSKGCYPLYIDDYTRKNGLLKHIRHIIKNWSLIVKCLEQAKVWNPELEKKLDPYYFDIKH